MEANRNDQLLEELNQVVQKYFYGQFRIEHETQHRWLDGQHSTEDNIVIRIRDESPAREIEQNTEAYTPEKEEH